MLYLEIISNFKKFLKKKEKYSKCPLDNLEFRKVDSKIFPIFKLKNRVNEHYSTPIILNSANETLVDLYLKKNQIFGHYKDYF